MFSLASFAQHFWNFIHLAAESSCISVLLPSGITLPGIEFLIQSSVHVRTINVLGLFCAVMNKTARSIHVCFLTYTHEQFSKIMCLEWDCWIVGLLTWSTSVRKPGCFSDWRYKPTLALPEVSILLMTWHPHHYNRHLPTLHLRGGQVLGPAEGTKSADAQLPWSALDIHGFHMLGFNPPWIVKERGLTVLSNCKTFIKLVVI